MKLLTQAVNLWVTKTRLFVQKFWDIFERFMQSRPPTKNPSYYKRSLRNVTSQNTAEYRKQSHVINTLFPFPWEEIHMHISGHWHRSGIHTQSNWEHTSVWSDQSYEKRFRSSGNFFLCSFTADKVCCSPRQRQVYCTL